MVQVLKLSLKVVPHLVFALHLPNTVILLLHIVIVISSLYSISCMMEEGLLLFGSSSNFSLLVYYCVCVSLSELRS